MPIRIEHSPQLEEKTYFAYRGLAPFPLVTIGSLSYGYEFFIHWMGEPSQVKIGRCSSIAREVHFFAGYEHHTEWATTYPFTHLPEFWSELRALEGHPLTRGDIQVGHDVWIGYGAMIRSGVTIGNGAVVGMAAVVTRDVPPYAVVAGVPAKVVRYRFSPDVIEQLNQLAWWDWPLEAIRTSGVLPPQRSLAGWRIGGETKGFNAPESHNLGVACCSTYFFNSSTVTPPQEATK